VTQTGNVRLMVREGPWKLIPSPPQAAAQRPELYNLADDIGETKNLAAQHPDQVKRLTELLRQVRESGHSRPAGK